MHKYWYCTLRHVFARDLENGHFEKCVCVHVRAQHCSVFQDRPPFIPPGVHRRSRATSAAALGMPLEPLEDVPPQRTRKLVRDGWNPAMSNCFINVLSSSGEGH